MEAMSMYVALWLTEWYDKFQNNNWITSKGKPIAQRSILIECGKMIQERKRKMRPIQIEKVHAHSGMTSGATTDDIKRIIVSKRISQFSIAGANQGCSEKIELLVVICLPILVWGPYYSPSINKIAIKIVNHATCSHSRLWMKS